MNLHQQMPCAHCPDTQTGLQWQTVTIDGLTVRNVPVYVCPSCQDETMELVSAVVFEEQMATARSQGLTDTTMTLPDGDRDEYLRSRTTHQGVDKQGE